MASTQTYAMGDQRKRIMALVREVAAWKADYLKTRNEESKKVHNRLCDTLDACNEWLVAYEGDYRIVNNVEMGPIHRTWSRID